MCLVFGTFVVPNFLGFASLIPKEMSNTKIDNKKLVELHLKEKKSCIEIAKEFNISPNTVRYRLKGEGIKPINYGLFEKYSEPWHKGKKSGIVPKTAFKKGHVPWTFKNLNEKDIIRYYEEGKSSLYISKKFDCSKTTILRILKENGIKRRSLSDSHKGNEPWNKGVNTGIVPKTAFKKGFKPWNKGKKTGIKPSSAFKKGLIPWNRGKEMSDEFRRNNRIAQQGFDIDKFKQKIIGLYDGGHSTISISKRFEVSPTAIQHALKRYGKKLREPVWGIKGTIKTKDGHEVSSDPELIIDNFLYDNGIEHEYNKQINKKIDSNSRYDFYIPEIDLYIEYWGLQSIESYRKKTEKKIELYEKLELRLQQIFPQDDIIDKLKFLIPLCAKKQKILRDF